MAVELTLVAADGTELGEFRPWYLDCEWGAGDENSFEVEPRGGTLEPGMRICELGGECGGIVTRYKDGRWLGPTWRGLLAARIVTAAAGGFSVSGDANAALASVIERCGLGFALAASADECGTGVSYTFEAGQDANEGVSEMLAEAGLKLVVRHDGSRAVLSAEPSVDWSDEAEFDVDFVDVEIDRETWFVNHLVCAGEGQEGDRVTCDLFLDREGNVSQAQTITGADERQEYYGYTSADLDKLVEGGTKRLKERWAARESVKVTVEDGLVDIDVGDVVGGRDPVSGESARATVTSKVVRISGGGAPTVEFATDKS